MTAHGYPMRLLDPNDQRGKIRRLMMAVGEPNPAGSKKWRKAGVLHPVPKSRDGHARRDQGAVVFYQRSFVFALFGVGFDRVSSRFIFPV